MSRAAIVSASNALKATNDFYMAALEAAYQENEQLRIGMKRLVEENQKLYSLIPKDNDPEKGEGGTDG